MSQDLERQIRELRAQVELLASQADKSPEPASGTDPAASREVTGVGPEESALGKKLEEIMELLKHDLEQIPATSAVAIFALGVLMGRMLPR